jgi:hypothetical protein
MSWNYRIIRYPSGGYGLHEVYYDDETGVVTGRTVNPVSFECHESEGSEAITEALERALKDTKERPLLQDHLNSTTK